MEWDKSEPLRREHPSSSLGGGFVVLPSVDLNDRCALRLLGEPISRL